MSNMKKQMGNLDMRDGEFVVSCGGLRPAPEIPGWALSAREWNRIVCAVNSRQTAEAAGLKSAEEIRLHERMWREAEALLEKYGAWPKFGLMELE